MFDRFNAPARRAVVRAYEKARTCRHTHIDTAHLLFGLLDSDDDTSARALSSLGINLGALRREVDHLVGCLPDPGADTPGRIPLTSDAERVLSLTLHEADQLGHRVVGTEHLLIGLVRQRDGAAARQLRGLGADLPHVRRQALLAREGGDPPPGW